MSAHGIGALQDCKILDVASDEVVDTAGYEGVIFVNTFTAPSGSNELQLRDGLLSGGGDQADITNANLTGEATPAALAVELHKPMKRYVSCTVTGGTAMHAILYAASQASCSGCHQYRRRKLCQSAEPPKS